MLVGLTVDGLWTQKSDRAAAGDRLSNEKSHGRIYSSEAVLPAIIVRVVFFDLAAVLAIGLPSAFPGCL